MPWEVRGNRRYYYQPVRADGRPRRIYRGAGDVGRVHELLTAHERRVRADRKAAATAHAAEAAELLKRTARVRWWAGQLVRAARLLGGEYQHKGQWRRRSQHTNTRRGNTMATTNPTGPAGDSDPAALGRRLLGLNERANGGDQSTLDELEDLLDRHPRVWQNYADLTADTTAGWAGLLTRGQPVEAACLRRQTATWAAELAGPEAQPLVTAAAEAAKVAWLAMRYAEAELLAAPAAKRSAALTRLTTANRQFQESLKLVATARLACATRTEPAAAEGQALAAPRLFGGTG